VARLEKSCKFIVDEGADTAIQHGKADKQHGPLVLSDLWLSKC
jgi:hypothetical protein